MIKKDAVIEHFNKRLKTSDKYLYKPPNLDLPIRSEGIYLEAGCGTTLTWDPKDNFVIGLDIVPNMLRNFQIQKENIHLILGDVLFLPFREKSFSIVSANYLLHHLIGDNRKKSKNNIKKALKELDKSVINNGVLLVREYLTYNKFYRNFMYGVTVFCAKYSINIKQLDIEDGIIIHFLTKSELIELLEQINYKTSIIENRPWIISHIKIGAISTIQAIKK